METNKAKSCLTEALEISKTLPGNLYTSTTWYGNMTTMIQEIRDKEIAKEEAKWENVREVHLEALKDVLRELRCVT